MNPFRKTDLEGYVEIDHRESPGLAPAEGRPNWLARFLGPGKHFKGATNYCKHCERTVIKNPDRTRDRGWCYGCDHFICDQCAVIYKLTGVCKPYQQVIDEFVDRQAKGA